MTLRSSPSVSLFILSSFLFLAANGLRAQTILTEEFWVDLQPVVPYGEQTVEKETAVNRVLEEARWVFSGMVYGFDFSYTPLDRARNVEEEFTLSLTAEILHGDPLLHVMSTRRENSKFFVRLRYALRDFQESWYRGLASNLYASASGRGSASYFDGPAAKIPAMESAVKNAVREYARTRIDNKPKTIRGSVVLDSAPRVVIDSGLYQATVTARLHIDEIVPYSVF